MNFSRLAVLAAALAATTLAGCTSSRFASVDTQPQPRSNTIAEPLEPAPAGQVTAGQLPPPGVPGQPGAVGANGFPTAPGTAPGAQPQTPPAQMASTGPAVSASQVAGVWNASVAGQGCRVATPQTKFGQGFRAGPLRCPAPLDGVKSWNVEGSQLALYDQNGSVLARLYSSGGSRFDGQTSNGQPISLSR